MFCESLDKKTQGWQTGKCYSPKFRDVQKENQTYIYPLAGKLRYIMSYW